MAVPVGEASEYYFDFTTVLTLRTLPTDISKVNFRSIQPEWRESGRTRAIIGPEGDQATPLTNLTLNPSTLDSSSCMGVFVYIGIDKERVDTLEIILQSMIFTTGRN
eukprot:g32906.t1